GLHELAGGQAKRLPGGWRHHHAVGEVLEDRRVLRPAYVVLVLAESSLRDTGEAGDPPLSYAVVAEDVDDDAEIAVAARVQHIRTREDSLRDLAYVDDIRRHGAHPVPVVARPMSAVTPRKSITS